ncbi:hypothetical protein FJZ40_04220, partial [Candidatus Shapirobacteria bacterium]|nr:hypothetical protein [Candidatus Shapirobacteria bacterium]
MPLYFLFLDQIMTKNEIKIPKVRFVDTPELQANYLCFLASQIQEWIYQKHGFAVLPYPTNHSQAVYFPDLPYSLKFWQSIRR